MNENRYHLVIPSVNLSPELPSLPTHRIPSTCTVKTETKPNNNHFSQTTTTFHTNTSSPMYNAELKQRLRATLAKRNKQYSNNFY